MAEPMPIQLIAKALRPFGLCLVHEHTLRQARDLIADGDHTLTYDEQQFLLARLDEVLKAEKPSDLVG